jgi:hypothetical protein
MIYNAYYIFKFFLNANFCNTFGKRKMKKIERHILFLDHTNFRYLKVILRFFFFSLNRGVHLKGTSLHIRGPIFFGNSLNSLYIFKFKFFFNNKLIEQKVHSITFMP